MEMSFASTSSPCLKDLRAKLSADHARLDALFEEVLEASRADARDDLTRLWTQFEAGLQHHFDLEEEYMIPRFAEAAPREAAGLVEDHRRILALVAELGVGVDLHMARHDAVSELFARLRAHAKREDAWMYRWAESNLWKDRDQDRIRLLDALISALGWRPRS